MEWVIGGVFVIMGYLLFGSNSADTEVIDMAPETIDPPGSGSAGGHSAVGWTAESWRNSVGPLAESRGINADFAIQWIRVESGGNPCAVGSLTAKGPDGNPQEIGIAQLYNPDDFANLGINAGKLREYCQGGSQSCSRDLTGEEMGYAAAAAVALMSHCRDKAHSYLVSNGCNWNEHDQYCITKLWHGLPGIVTQGLSATRQYLGHGPTSWAEFRSALNNVRLDSGTERYRAEFTTILNNAEKTAGVVP